MKKDKKEIISGTLETFGEHLQWDPNMDKDAIGEIQKTIRNTFEGPNYRPYDQRGTEEKWIKKEDK